MEHCNNMDTDSIAKVYILNYIVFAFTKVNTLMGLV